MNKTNSTTSALSVAFSVGDTWDNAKEIKLYRAWNCQLPRIGEQIEITVPGYSYFGQIVDVYWDMENVSRPDDESQWVTAPRICILIDVEEMTDFTDMYEPGELDAEKAEEE